MGDLTANFDSPVSIRTPPEGGVMRTASFGGTLARRFQSAPLPKEG